MDDQTNSFILDSTIPLPQKWKKRERYPLREMQVGHSFAVSSQNVQSVREAVSQFQRRNAGYVFTVRKFDGGYRCWRTD